MRQVWFPGVHSNVGGGYDQHGLSDVPLAWMAAQVEPMLALDFDYLLNRQDRRSMWAMGMLYDSASGAIWSSLPRERRRPFTKVPQEDAHEELHPSVRRRGMIDAEPEPGPYRIPAELASAREAELLELEARLQWAEAVPPAPSTAPREGLLAELKQRLERLL